MCAVPQPPSSPLGSRSCRFHAGVILMCVPIKARLVPSRFLPLRPFLSMTMSLRRSWQIGLNRGMNGAAEAPAATPVSPNAPTMASPVMLRLTRLARVINAMQVSKTPTTMVHSLAKASSISKTGVGGGRQCGSQTVQLEMKQSLVVRRRRLNDCHRQRCQSRHPAGHGVPADH